MDLFLKRLGVRIEQLSLLIESAVRRVATTLVMAVDCNLYDQWIVSLRTNFAANGFDASTLDDRECAVRWWSWRRRIVKPRKRRICRVAGFSCPHAFQSGLSRLEDAVETGVPLWPWHSTRIDNKLFEDQMYNDFGILHFHLGDAFQSDGYIQRTGELLFALVAESEFYELGIFDHGDWCELDLLELVDTNWPTLLDPFTIEALSVAIEPKSADQVKQMRKARINTSFSLASGRIILPPGGGLATDGTSAKAVSYAQHWSKFFRKWEAHVSNEIALQIKEGSLEDRDYSVILELEEDQISALIPSVQRWILWKGRDTEEDGAVVEV